MVKKSWQEDGLCSKRFCASLLRKSAQQERKKGRRVRGREKKTFLLLVQNPTFSPTRTEALPKLSGEYHLVIRLPVALCKGIIFCYGQILFPFQVYLFINDPHPTHKSKMIVPIAEGPGSQPLLGHGSTIFSSFDVCAAQNLIGLSVGFAQLQLNNNNIRFLHNKNASKALRHYLRFPIISTVLTEPSKTRIWVHRFCPRLILR